MSVETLKNRPLKTIGLLGGMSWESTQTYYRIINQEIRQRLGKMHSAQIALFSVDFELIEQCQRQGNWTEAGNILADSAKKVEASGADCLLICTNTMHKVYQQVEEAISIPLLHIADTTGKCLIDQGVTKVGLLGTAFTMEQDFYKQRLSETFNLQVLIPDQLDRQLVHRVIYEELCLGVISEASRNQYRNIINKLAEQGAEAIILGCTEIGLLISTEDVDIPIYDTTEIHALAAVDFALE
ncbi:aspartate/glutamate racemase family protein [Aliikangiella coralliicola]|uniref:Aspartate/glutamate racemase family protein n=1 Tax=Aliikangiella coralliicola TaxID=2592383 RepID=A0A545UD50_9GAMM|nr:aspartate/glutamate racemase family protein [Aliikangiella coralliicola]TQV87385.1 aspartate/glutamate racemase family protein [Aliikangiella coralliicola]